MKRHIPNFITLLNVLCGCIATVFAVSNKLEVAAGFVFLGIFFDFFDGLAARVLNVKSELGLQLDSLADMITSGLVPGIAMFQLLRMSYTGGWNLNVANGATESISWELFEMPLLPFFGFIITMASAYRLAKFNLDENQVSSFVGLPTPANALLILSFPLMLIYHNNDFLNELILNQWFLIGVTLFSAFLLNAKISLFALKFKNWSLRDNANRYIFLIVSVVFLLTMKFMAIPAILAFYVGSSIVSNISAKNKV
ncbi:CDP-diacylglycerol---serine O-phosphatidyltransferase [Arenibacter nanhaiticus]|uniref:CDP-diacylglycerol---serine O-phosphatidyltransferase n=1 Tax=Arenibacter nanhaiticus TaxID=558155 RepID=A0A1M6BB64_9FLAO|nr:CDP-alcohol phosphatidyltransferase family protein [Arenibacter nanhaiticus]SHI45969.1 CDP-diacylglycerol---serine O-phosphatidyltransferase [Arenibacter nanhaiticus]